uniref:Tetratricopeptide repeat protein n=1 Tax=Schlesneria paludicola TaxID=360056 RepID=A0A7C2JZ80_9PLAN
MSRPLTIATALWLGVTSAAWCQVRFAPASPGDVQTRVFAWLETQRVDAETRAKVEALWQSQGSAAMEPQQLAELAVASWCLADPALAAVMRPFRESPSDLPVQSAVPPVQDPFVLANLQAYAGRRFAEQRLYDEALEQFESLDLSLVIDPAATLFYRAVAAQAVLNIPQTMAALEQLLSQTDRVPVRYVTVATLMQSALETYEEKSLDEIARLMSDSERRLDLGRAGERVQGVQDKIIAGLDELIKKLEAQQGGGGGGGQSSNSNESSSPAEDSTIKGATAPGETDPKKFRKEGEWGDLPAKQQAAAKNLINRNFPSHYGQAIETYFKKLAGRPAAPDK